MLSENGLETESSFSIQPLHLIVDSTGLSIHGEGLWLLENGVEEDGERYILRLIEMELFRAAVFQNGIPPNRSALLQ